MLRNVLIRSLLAVLAFAACLLSILRLDVARQYRAFFLNSEPFNKSGKSQIGSRKVTDATRFEDLMSRQQSPEIASVIEARLENFLNQPLTNFEERSGIAIRYSRLAERQQDPEKKIQFLCRTLEALSAALKKEPMQARTLVTWANVKQLLGSYRCPNDISGGFEAALTLAFESDPLDQQALFNAGLVFLWAKQNDKAYPLFRRVLELATDSSQFQREFIYSLASNAETLSALIPARFPQALEYTRFLLSAGDLRKRALIPAKVLWEYQSLALQEFAQRFENGEIDSDIFVDRLVEFWKLSKESPVSMQLDKMLASFFGEQGRQELADFFSTRSRFSELEIVAGFKSADSRPEKSALSNWSYGKEIALDEFFSSVGFYLPVNNTLRRIEIHSNQRADTKVAGMLRVFQSDDNSSWEDVTGVCMLSQVIVAGRAVIYIDLPGSGKKFWKVHFASPARERNYRGTLSAMLRAFGVGALKG